MLQPCPYAAHALLKLLVDCSPGGDVPVLTRWDLCEAHFSGGQLLTCCCCRGLCHCRQVLGDVVARGADPANIRVVAMVAAPPALKKMADTYPG